jgi:hypothetical protein
LVTDIGLALALLLMARRLLFETPKREVEANGGIGRGYDEAAFFRFGVAAGADAKAARVREAADVPIFC